MDPLLLLREYLTQGKPIIDDEENLVMGDYVCPKKTTVNFKNTNVGGGYYTLGTMYYAYKLRELEHGAYVLQERNAGRPSVWRGDKKNFLAFFEGNQVDNIDKTLFVEPAKRIGSSAAAAPAAPKRGPTDGVSVDEDTSKRPRTESADGAAADAEIRPISEQLNVEKMKELKAKAKAKKSKTFDTSGAPSALSDDITAMDTSRDIVKRERIYETRESILRLKNKRFDSVIEKFKQANFKPENASSSAAANASAAAAGAAGAQKKKDAAPSASQQPYERYNQPGAKGDR